MKLIDTHTHLFLEQFDNDREDVVNRAISAGVEKILLPNVDSGTINALLELSNKFPDNCLPFIGLHPTSVKENFEKELEIVTDWLKKRKFYAIGETGIDLYWDKSYFDKQKIAFEFQIELAKENNLPLIIHARDSYDEIFKIIEKKKDKNLKGIFHSFTGTLSQAKRIIEFGFIMGIGGIVTFKNSGLDNVVQEIDLSNIVLETDSPYLTPAPYRGKRNESSYLIYVTEKISELHGISVEEVADITTKNAIELFRI